MERLKLIISINLKKHGFMKRIYLMLFLTFAFFGLANAQCPVGYPTTNNLWAERATILDDGTSVQLTTGGTSQPTINFGAFESVNADPNLYSGKIKLRIKNNTPYTSVQMFLFTSFSSNGSTADQDLRYDLTISANDTEVKEYIIDYSDKVIEWLTPLDETDESYIKSYHRAGFHFAVGADVTADATAIEADPTIVSFVVESFELLPNEGITPLAPANVKATMAGVITWDDACAASYNVVVSPTELDETALATATSASATGTTYTATGLTSATTYYVYVQAVNANGGSAWASTSFYYYEGATCQYIVSGGDIYYYDDPQPWGYYAEYSPNVEFWQNGVLVAQVRGDARAGVGISLISGQPVEIVWNAIYGYWDDPDKLLITNAAGDTLFYSEELFDFTPVTIGTFETTGCGLTEQSVGGEAVFWKAPEAATLSVAKGDLLPAIAGISVTHNFAQPVVSKSDGGAPTVTYNGVAYDNQTIAQADGDNGQNYIFSPTADGLLDICGKMGTGKKNFIFETATPVETLVTYTTKNAGEVTDKVAVDVVAVGKDANGDDMTIPKGVWDASAAINNTGGNAYVVMSFEVKAGKNYVVGVDGSKFMLVGYRYEPGGKFTAIPSLISADKTVKAVQYFDITGRAVKANAKGLIIEKTIYTDGTSSAKKVLRIDDSFKYSK
jgi:hypothetical protein